MDREDIAIDAMITFNERVNMFIGEEFEALLNSVRSLRTSVYFFDLYSSLPVPFDEVFDLAGFVVIVTRSAQIRTNYNVTIQVAWRVTGRQERNRDGKILQQFLYNSLDGSFHDSLGAN